MQNPPFNPEFEQTPPPYSLASAPEFGAPVARGPSISNPRNLSKYEYLTNFQRKSYITNNRSHPINIHNR